MGDFLFVATLIIVGLVVLVLVFYLTGTIIYLFRAGAHLKKLANELQKVESDTGLLQGKLTTINGALEQLLTGLTSVNSHLGAIAKVLKL